jgi:hypothetical protein
MATSIDDTQAVAANKLRRYRKAAALLRKWLAEPEGYDERTWPALEEELKDSALRCRENDEPAA